MNAKKRYSLIFLTCLVCCSAFVVYRKSTRSWRGSVRLSTSQLNGQPYSERKRPSFLDVNDEFSLHDNTGALKELENLQTSKCTMKACFDRTKCLDEFKIYVYPIQANEKISPLFGKVLKVLRESDFYTEDPNRACLFIPSIDTLDRDKLSDAYVHQVNAKVTSLPYWNDGKNHVIFNLFSGTWPDYKEDLSFNAGKAILAKASRSVELFRPGFDISFPLLPKSHPHKGRETANNAYSAVFPLERKYKLGFKGKRYLNGIGSESRNSLYHIHNGKDIILLTTCKHGQSWTKHKDERCDKDNEEYEKYDYDELLRNATFCLVPRGRRLGSYRFLESIQAGCIPVVLSNGWQLPFSEVIDWTKALIQGDERLLTEVPSVVRSYSTDQILALKQQALFLWEAYFSSIEKVILTTLEVIHSRIAKNRAAIFPMWNTFPGALVSHPQYSRSPQDFPFYNIKLGMQVEDKFTAVIYSTTSIMKESSALSRLLKNVGQSKMVSKVVVLWMADAPVTHNKKWPQINVPIVVVKPETKTANSRFVPRSVIDTSAVLSLDEDIKLNSDEIDFAFSVWRVFPDRIVGFPARNHHWDDSHSQWFYSSTWSNEYSMVLTSGAFYHKYYNFAYTNNLPPRVHRMVEHYGVCDDLAMNFLVADITRKPPIKVLPQTSLPNLFSRNTKYTKLMQLFEHRQKCMETLVDAFGYMPLLKSQVRMDPLLYRDPVSNLRKRYRLLEV